MVAHVELLSCFMLPPKWWLRAKPFPGKLRSSPSCRAVPNFDNSLLEDVRTQRKFLQTVWGVKPVVLRNLLPGYESPVTGDDLAALSSDPIHHSRLIHVSAADSRAHEPPYTLSVGPFPESIWATLPSRNWTLLVQDLERSVPAASDLLDFFSFLPAWRTDDVQASYAVPGGGVGPHVDNYDVFLVQAAGTRRWRVSHTPIPANCEHIIPGIDVRVLRDPFPVDGDYILYPGDALYVPPRFPHHGVSLDDECITLSVGFRAPTAASLLIGWVEHLIQTRHLNKRFYQDNISDLVKGVSNSGRIEARSADGGFELVSQFLTNDTELRQEFNSWFIREMSQRKNSADSEHGTEEGEENDNAVKNTMQELLGENVSATCTASEVSVENVYIRQNPEAAFIYTEDNRIGRCCLYINGKPWPVDTTEIAQTLCDRRSFTIQTFRQLARKYESFSPLVAKLIEAGLFYVDKSHVDVCDFDNDIYADITLDVGDDPECTDLRPE